jgi:hypothetical protein
MVRDIRELERFAPRRGTNEHSARSYIESRLNEENIPYIVQSFDSFLPRYVEHSLTADGEPIECMPTALVSGEITEKNIISSMAVSGRYYEEPNINFNPYADSISLATHYRAPSVAVRRRDVQRIIDSKSIHGTVTVVREPHSCANIIAGNVSEPKNVVIVHYDSVANGADDDASGVAMLLRLAEDGAGIDNMLVFSGCEELSFDSPIYWGKGYRELEKRFFPALSRSRNIIAVDMIGSGMPGIMKNPKYRLAAFPISDKRLFDRSTVIGTLGDEWFSTYHSCDDTLNRINPEYVDAGLGLVKGIIAAQPD